MTDPATPLRCPYVGLQPYTEADIDYFFGRERDQRIIAANLGATRLTILYGASGVGKSSVLLAGVVPSLRARPRTAVAVVRDWRGPNFIDALKSECREAVERVLQEPLSIDAALPLDEFLGAAEQALRGSLLIIFDQFEEYFLYHPESETGQTFDAELARAVNRDDVDASFLIVMREDGLAKLDRFGGRIPNLLGNTLRLQHLTAADAEAAIRKPLDVFNEQHAAAAPIAIEDALVDAIIDQVRSGQVALSRSGGVGQVDGTDETGQIEAPFLQLVMTRLWEEEVNSGSRTLRLATLGRLGGAEQIVRLHLDGVMNSLDGARQEVCAKFFDRLVTPSGAKIACAIRDLTDWAGPSSGGVAPILETLCASRILRGVAIPGANRPSDTSYEIYNDVIAPAILDWRRGYLQAQERAAAERRAAEQAQAEAKMAYANRVRNWKRAAIGFAIVAIASLSYLAYQQHLQLEASDRQARARELAAAAENIVDSVPELGTLLAIEAVRVTYLADGSVADNASAILEQIVHKPRAEMSMWTVGSHPVPKKVVFSANPRLLATSGEDGTVKIWDLDARRLRGTLSPQHSNIFGLTFSKDGSRLVTANTDGQVKVWDLNDIKADQSAEPIYDFDAEITGAVVVVLSEDAKSLVTAGEGGGAKVWNLAQRPIGSSPFGGPNLPSSAKGVALSRNGTRLAVGSQNRDRVEIWDTKRNQRSWSSKGPNSGDDAFWDVALSPSGQYLAALSNTGLMMLWDVNSGQFLPLPSDFLAQKNPSVGAGLAFSPDGTRLAAAYPKTVVVWDIAHLKTAGVWDIATLRALVRWDLPEGDNPRYIHVNKVQAVAFSSDGRQLATVTDEGTIQIWPLAAEDLIAAAKELVPRSFSEDECKKYRAESCQKSR